VTPSHARLDGIEFKEEVRAMSASQTVYTKVAHVMTQVLNVDGEEITPYATLQGDLGAESVDFLDIVFRLEREFGIKIPHDELFPESVFQDSPLSVCDGKVVGQATPGEIVASSPISRYSSPSDGSLRACFFLAERPLRDSVQTESILLAATRQALISIKAL
jgi:acyl carrier protein